jgi:hypothetical protein
MSVTATSAMLAHPLSSWSALASAGSPSLLPMLAASALSSNNASALASSDSQSSNKIEAPLAISTVIVIASSVAAGVFLAMLCVISISCLRCRRHARSTQTHVLSSLAASKSASQPIHAGSIPLSERAFPTQYTSAQEGTLVMHTVPDGFRAAMERRHSQRASVGVLLTETLSHDSDVVSVRASMAQTKRPIAAAVNAVGAHEPKLLPGHFSTRNFARVSTLFPESVPVTSSVAPITYFSLTSDALDPDLNAEFSQDGIRLGGGLTGATVATNGAAHTRAGSDRGGIVESSPNTADSTAPAPLAGRLLQSMVPSSQRALRRIHSQRTQFLPVSSGAERPLSTT